MENFENSQKSDYSNQLLTLQSGQWIFSNAQLGISSSDKKNALQGARIVADGSISMAQPVLLGGDTKVMMSVALYGSGTSGKWVLMASNNGGAFEKVGDTIITISQTLSVVTIPYKKAGWTSFAIQKGGGNTLNFDDFTITTKTTAHPIAYIASPAYVYNYSTKPPVVTEDNSNLLLGNPSNATTNATATPNNYLMENPYYVISYSRDRGTPNWVSWHLQKTDYGAVSRTDNYQPNLSLPDGWYRVMPSGYDNTYTRGHNCPSGDRTSSIEANWSVFLMTNMIPQSSANNNGVWNNLENYTRSLTDAGNECYIVMGSYGNKGTIDNGRVTVPTNIWKVILVLPAGNNDLARIDAGTRIICVNTPNDETVNSDWKTHRVSLKTIQDVTGYNLLSNVNATVKAALLSKIDTQP